MKRALAALFLLSAVMCFGQDEEVPKKEWALKFEEYPARSWTGTPAKPIIPRSWRTFRTRIKEAAAKRPTYAGHYTLALWGCGTECVAGVVIDSKTGAVLDLPIRLPLTFPWLGEKRRDWGGLIFKRESRLLIVDGCQSVPETDSPDEAKCGTHYFELRNGKFELLQFELERPSSAF